ncbi:MAG: acyl-ACP--UDP-N-acetylglucosamine O-acyltransferase [Puniceicoccales bacterium]|jgi:UDP-N-acetylglucosamine acyltransferase|nr:acyl-ACP--UDP-N-acetylglucosamine O-acyltransferase [Puniceicoccales bacterium]
MIHSTAIIGSNARLGTGVTVGPYAIIENDTVIGDNCQIAAHAVIKQGTQLRDNVSVDHHAVIGGLPQDTSFDPAIRSGVVVGRGTKIRESVTIHRSTKEGKNTVIGEECFLMALAHIAHDCVLGNGIILANTATLAGHIYVEDKAFISGGVVVHQFVRIGENAMVSGNARIGMDVPPYSIALERNHIAGLNLVGLRRRGFSRSVIYELKNCYRAVYQDGKMNLQNNAAEAIAQGVATTTEGKKFLEFFTQTDASKRHQFVRPRTSVDQDD